MNAKWMTPSFIYLFLAVFETVFLCLALAILEGVENEGRIKTFQNPVTNEKEDKLRETYALDGR